MTRLLAVVACCGQFLVYGLSGAFRHSPHQDTYLIMGAVYGAAFWIVVSLPHNR